MSKRGVAVELKPDPKEGPGAPVRLDELVGESTDLKETCTAPEELILTAKKQITIRCGESSITLTKAGKIIIRGKYILSRSAGVNRIKGGAVQIN